MKKWQGKMSKFLTVVLLGSQFLYLAPLVQGAELSPAKKETIPLQLLGVNDFHGALDTVGTAYLDGERHENVGKVANLANQLTAAEKRFKSENATGTTERIQAGDLVGASPANSALLQDEPTIKVFNRMGFTLGTLGNHEFDQGLAEFNRIMTGTAPTPGQFNPIVDNYPREASEMEIVIANVVTKKDQSIPNGYKPYTIREYGTGDATVKVGYIGVITTEFPNLVLKEHHQDFNVLDEADTITKYAKELREQGINAIVVISHLPAISSGEEVQGEVKTVMDKVNAQDPKHSVDVVFASHNHQYTNGVIDYPETSVRVVQSTSNGKAFIDLQAELDIETQDFAATATATVKPTTDSAGQDADVQAIVDHASLEIVAVTEEKIALADDNTTKAGNISREYNAHSESALGNLVVDAQLYMANQAKLTNAAGQAIQVDFALTNNGGIRDDLKIKANGEITWGAAQAVQPFGNILQVVEISGKDLKGALGEQHQNGKLHYFLQIAGLKLTYTGVGDEFVVETLTDTAGQPIKDDQLYNIVINDFLLGGGDGFKSFTKGKLVTAMDTDTNTFVDYFKLMSANDKKITAPAVDRKTEYTGEVAEDLLKLDDLANLLAKVKDYTAEGRPVKLWQAFETARGEAQTLYDLGLLQNEANTSRLSQAAITQAEIDQAVEKLNKAEAALSHLDTTDLKAYLKTVATKKEEAYTKETWQPFAFAKIQAENFIREAESDKTTLQQADIDQALKDLKKADQALVKVSQDKVTDKDKKGTNGGKLPQTGESVPTTLVAVGLLLASVSLVVVIRRRQLAN